MSAGLDNLKSEDSQVNTVVMGSKALRNRLNKKIKMEQSQFSSHCKNVVL